MTIPTEQTIIAWARLLKAHQSAFNLVEAALKKAGYPPLNWYDVLLELERAGDKGLRPFELQDKLLLPQYGISRLINRIENASYLQRIDCEDDGRGQRIKITNAGKNLRKRMWQSYGQAIEKAVGEKLTTEQVNTLSKLLASLYC